MTEPHRIGYETQKEIQNSIIESVRAYNYDNHRLATHHAREAIKQMVEHGLLQPETTPGHQSPSHPLSTQETAVLMRQLMIVVETANRGEWMQADAAARALNGLMVTCGVLRQ